MGRSKQDEYKTPVEISPEELIRRHTCFVCDKLFQQSLRACSGCPNPPLYQTVRYCGTICQIKDWKHDFTDPQTGHKFICDNVNTAHLTNDQMASFFISKNATLNLISIPLYQRTCYNCQRIFQQLITPCHSCNNPHIRFCSHECAHSSDHLCYVIPSWRAGVDQHTEEQQHRQMLAQHHRLQEEQKQKQLNIQHKLRADLERQRLYELDEQRNRRERERRAMIEHDQYIAHEKHKQQLLKRQKEQNDERTKKNDLIKLNQLKNTLSQKKDARQAKLNQRDLKVTFNTNCSSKIKTQSCVDTPLSSPEFSDTDDEKDRNMPASPPVFRSESALPCLDSDSDDAEIAEIQYDIKCLEKKLG
jgi:hypothetical protein